MVANVLVFFTAVGVPFFATGFLTCAEMVRNVINRQRTKKMFRFMVRDFVCDSLKLGGKYNSAIDKQKELNGQSYVKLTNSVVKA